MSVFLRFAIIGLFVAWLAAAVGLAGPSKAFPHAGWFDGGIRLLRDEREVNYYFTHSAWISRGGAQYVQEYPPLGVLFFSLPRPFTDDFRTFQVLFVLMTSVAFALLIGLTASLLRSFGRSPRLALLMLLPASLYFSLWRFDVLPALFVAASLYALGRGKTAPSLVLMFLSVLTKWYAALFFTPLFMFIGSTSLGEAERHKLWSAMAALVAAAITVVVAATLLTGFGSLADPVLYHLSRDFEVGAFGTAVILGLRKLGIAGQLSHAVVSWLFLVGQFAAIVPLVLHGRIKDGIGLVRAFIFLLIPFMVFGHFFSAQWIVWLLPLTLLVAGPIDLALLVGLDLVLFLQFPVLFGISPFTGSYLSVSLLRTGLLAALWWRNFMRMRSSAGYIFR